ncbi:MAG: hypothetical protein MZV70_69445 [Desulfobacterales bacterium]|nr:hypothetical protein [Desulfobacterales bacterium]
MGGDSSLLEDPDDRAEAVERKASPGVQGLQSMASMTAARKIMGAAPRNAARLSISGPDPRGDPGPPDRSRRARTRSPRPGADRASSASGWTGPTAGPRPWPGWMPSSVGLRRSRGAEADGGGAAGSP